MQHSPYFRLLGALDAEVAGVGIQLGSPQARAMLSLLLLRANGLCSLDQLVQDLWGETPPSSARAQVQNHVSALRRTLESAGGDAASILVTRPPGYLLNVGPDQTDLMVFRRLVTAARAHRERGDLSSAVTEFRTALDLWRGTVLCDVTLPAVRDLAAPLDELRVDAVEDWAETALSAGAGEELAAELGAVVAHHPLRERLRATLMRALAATGRTAEALEVYRTGRAVLVEELGIEPGTDLRDAHRTVLSGGATPGAPDSGGMPTPADDRRPVEALPADLTDFSGRRDAVRTGARVLCERPPHAPAILGVSGPAGVGKTSFAVHLAHVTRRTYPSGRILIRLDVDADNSPRTVLTWCLRALDVPAASIPAELPEQARLLQSHLRQAPFLIVIDGVTHEAQVRPLLDLETRCGVILTSRRRLDGLDSVGHLELSPMSEQESVELIRRTIGPDRADAMPAHTATLVRYCEGLPLALRICAARLTARPAWTVGDLVARLAAERSRLDWLKTGDRAVRTSFDTTYQQIDELDRRLFRRLGMLNMPTFPAWVAGALLGVDHELGERVLDALGDVRLVEPAGRSTTGPRYQMHNLLRIFARERAAREDRARDTDAALGRALDGWLALVQEADTVSSGKYVMDPEPEPAWRPPPYVLDDVRADPVTWRETEQPCLVAAVRLAVERGRPQSAWPLAQRTSTYYDTVNQLEGWQSTLRTALGACQQASDAAGTACMLRHLAEAYSVGGRLDEAHETARAAQRIYARRDPRWGTAVLGPRIAFIHREQGRPAQARTRAEDALRAARAAGEPVALARALTCLALLDMDAEELGTADRLATAAHDAFAAAGSAAGAAETLGISGDVARRNGDFTTAERRLTDAIGAAQRCGDNGMTGLFTVYLARTRLALGRPHEAAALARTARDILRDAGDRYTEAFALAELAKATLTAHGPTTAVPVLAEGVEALRAVGALSRAQELAMTLADACKASGTAEPTTR